MRDITQEEITTLPGEWNPSLLDNSQNISGQRLRQFPPTPIDATDNFYNIQGSIIVQKSDINDTSIFSDTSSTSSGSRRRTYQAQTRKEKQKKHHSPKGKIIEWWDDKTAEIKTEESKFPTHPPIRPSATQSDPVIRFKL